jgi:outer membrane protein OmpA-like peptidoglycan-associated protein
MRPHFILSFVSAFAFLFSSGPAPAQSWLEALKDKAAQEVVEHGSDILHETADGKVKCVAGDQACIDQAQQEGKEVVLTNKKGKALPPDQQSTATSSATTTKTSTTSGSKTATSGGAGSKGAAASGQPNLTAVKSDFVPGDKTIFYDDFTDMAGDEAPPHWKVRGGTAELQVGDGIRQLTMPTHGMYVSPNIKSLPTNFTMEVDTQFGTLTGNGNGMIWRFMTVPDGPQTLLINTRVQEGGTRVVIFAGNPDNPENTADTVVQVNPRQPIQFALWVQDGRIRFYLNGKRAMDVNQIKLAKINYIDMEAVVEGEVEGAYAAIRRARFAETSPDFSKTIMSGRYVTHGILFDVDSDRIKPESAATIKMIASGMQANAGTNFLIEGHTDSTGDAAHNMDLSKRRAEAVKSVLVAQFGIDGARLTTAGLGSTKPVASNNTPQGKAENRRVEFVRQ